MSSRVYVVYEVTATPDPEIRAAYESYMRETHIRDVLETGCFIAARFATAASGQCRTSYIASQQEHLDRYLDQHAQRLRADFTAHFPAGVGLTRDVWNVVEEWQM
ncbi:MAG TPA: DUF4286 family protein [Thermoanaerobaculia bacterium]|nr:DUF4286 family protein [Thermoanaerobaculia bacterium]